MHAQAEIHRAAREQRRSERQRAAADGRIRWRIFRSPGQVRQLERMRVNRHAPLLGERLDVARVIEMAMREDDRQRRATEQRLAGSTDRPREAREAGVDEHPGAARGVTHEVRVDHERSQPIHVARHRFSSHGSPPLFAPVHEQRACRAIITAEGTRPMTRAKVISAAASLVAAVWLSTALAQTPAPPRFELDEATIADLQQQMQAGRASARSIAEQYIARIEAVDRSGPSLHSVIEVNPDALAIADQLDAERRAGRVRGPLHGIPILVKDNIATADKMMTTAGSLALAGVKPPADAFVAARLREAGAVILGKTNLSEWANFRSTHSSSGWSGRGGQTKNPYALDRNPSGSSSGSGAAVAANLAAAAVGTETDGSIVSPSTNNALVGIKPTLGLVSRTGIVPIAHSQDTAGPMARTVADAAALLAAMSGPDPAYPATRRPGPERGSAPTRPSDSAATRATASPGPAPTGAAAAVSAGADRRVRPEADYTRSLDAD